MNPADDNKNTRVGVPRSDQARQSTPPARNHAPSQTAAADIIRSQLSSIYGGGSNESTPHTTPAPASDSQATAPVKETAQTPQPQKAEPQTSHGLRTAPVVNESENTAAIPQQTQAAPAYRPQATPEQWNQYHSAWQKYYQMYYERYYVNHLNTNEQELSSYAAGQTASISSSTPIGHLTGTEADQSVSQQAAMRELRDKIRHKVRSSAKTVQKSRHFTPIIAGIIVLLLFMFLQYNRILFGAVAAYTTPGNIDPQNIIVDPTTDVEVGPEPKMIIPKINIDAPVIYGIGPDYKSQMSAMERGIAHFSIPGANAVPGQVGNAVFAAHSSNDAFAAGDYKFVFAQNEKLEKGDVIYMNYEGKRYTYAVTTKEVVLPKEVSKVQAPTAKPMIILVSCVPLGTAEKRLLVFAEQISPDPTLASTATEDSSAPEAAKIPGKPSPTIFERLFGAS